MIVSKFFRAYGLYNKVDDIDFGTIPQSVSKFFRAYGLYNLKQNLMLDHQRVFQSSFELTGYITL